MRNTFLLGAWALSWGALLTSGHARADSDSGQLGGLGLTYRLPIPSDLEIEGPKDDQGNLVIVPYQNGRRISSDLHDVDPGEPYCWFSVRYDSASFEQMRRRKKYPILVLHPTYLELSEIKILTESDGSSKQVRVEQVDFAIEKVWAGGFYAANGTGLSRASHKTSANRLTGLSCRGPALHLGDLKKVFGDAIRAPSIVQK